MDTEQAILGIMDVRKRIHEKDLWKNGPGLSDAMTRLAVYNAYLADGIAVAHKEATDKAYAVYTEAKASGESISQSEQMSRGESTNEREYYEKIQNIYKSTANLISVLQSRLRVLENQLKQEGIDGR